MGKKKKKSYSIWTKRTEPQIFYNYACYKKQNRPLLHSTFAGAQNLEGLIDLKVEIKLSETF